MKWYWKAIRNYANHKGRASRKEFWWFHVINLLVVFLLIFIESFWLAISFPSGGCLFAELSEDLSYGVLGSLYSIATLPAYICVTVRRFHDIGKSGKWYWLFTLPIVCLYCLYLLSKPSVPGINEYGLPAGRSNKNVVQTPKTKKGIVFIIAIIVLGCILIFFQLLSILGNPGAFPTFGFESIEGVVYSLFYSLGYFGIGIIGMILLVAGMRSYRKKQNTAAILSGESKKQPKPEAAEEGFSPKTASLPKEHSSASSIVQPMQHPYSAKQTDLPNNPKIQFCRKCGFKLLGNSNFCSHCGAPVLKEW